MGMVEDWLERIGLGYALPVFAGQGINSPGMLSELDVVDFPELGISDPQDRKKLFYLIQRVRLALGRLKAAKTTASPRADPAVSSTASTPSAVGQQNQNTRSTHSATSAAAAAATAAAAAATTAAKARARAPKDYALQRKSSTGKSARRPRRDREVSGARDAAEGAYGCTPGGDAGGGVQQTPAKAQLCLPPPHRRTKTPLTDAGGNTTTALAKQVAGGCRPPSPFDAREGKRGGDRTRTTAAERTGHPSVSRAGAVSPAANERQLRPRREKPGEESIDFERRRTREPSPRVKTAASSDSRGLRELPPPSPAASVARAPQRGFGGRTYSAGRSSPRGSADFSRDGLRAHADEGCSGSRKGTRIDPRARKSTGSSPARVPNTREEASDVEAKRLSRSQAQTRTRTRSENAGEATNDRFRANSTPGADGVSRPRRRELSGGGDSRRASRDRCSGPRIATPQRAQNFFECDGEKEEEGSKAKVKQDAAQALAANLIMAHRDDVRNALAAARKDMALVTKVDNDRHPGALLEYTREVEGVLGERLAAGARLRATLDSYVSLRQSTLGRPRGDGVGLLEGGARTGRAY